MTSIMTSVVKEGTARSLKLQHPIAGKTGTTNNNVDAWFVGFTPDIVCGVWVGRDDNKPMGKRETGSRAAIPIWKGFMKKTLEGMPIVDFKPPEDIVFVKIDKFQSARKALLSSQTRIKDIESLLKKIREVRLREDQELAAWEKDLTETKSYIEEVSKNLFDKME